MTDDLIKVLRAAATGEARIDSDVLLFNEAARRLEQRDELLAALKLAENYVNERREDETGLAKRVIADDLKVIHAAIKSAEA